MRFSPTAFGQTRGVIAGSIMALTLVCGIAQAQPATILYVDDNAAAGGNGSTWAMAFNKLETALVAAGSAVKPVEVRVAGGLYSGASAPDGAFFIPAEVSLLGAYRGLEPGGDPNEKNLALFPVTLKSNETPIPILSADNSGSITIDGFTVKKSSANMHAVKLKGGHITLRNLTVEGGLALDIQASDLLCEASQFKASADFSAFLHGISASHATIQGCSFKSSSQSGGLVLNIASGSVTQCTVEASNDSGRAVDIKLGDAVTFKNNTVTCSGFTGKAIRLISQSAILDSAFKATATTSDGPLTIELEAPLFENCPFTFFNAYNPSVLKGTFRSCEILASASVLFSGKTILSATDSTFESCMLKVGPGNLQMMDTGAFMTAQGCTFRDCTIDATTKVKLQNALKGADLALVDTTLSFGATMAGPALSTDNLSWIGGGIIGQSATSPQLVSAQGSVLLANVSVSGNTVNNAIASSLIDLPAGASVVNCTIANNQLINVANPASATAGIRSTGPVTLANSILYGNRVANANNLQAQQLVVPNGSTIASSAIEGWDGTLGGVGNHGLDPLFASGTFAPTSGSPSVDSGDASLLPADAFDLDGDGDVLEALPVDIAGSPRRIDDPSTPNTGPGQSPHVDRGAYELQEASCYPDCDGSGGLDIDDFICFQTVFAIGDPRADCDGSGLLDIDDFVCFQTAYALGC